MTRKTVPTEKTPIRLVLLAILSSALLAACASGGRSHPAKDCPKPDTTLTEYVIGPGDTLQIVVWRNDELSALIPVRPDGRISTPLIDDMVASGENAVPTQ